MRVLLSLVLGCLIATAALSRAAEPEATPPQTRDPAVITAAIDREVDKQLAQEKVTASPVASDAEFLRRVYLDITGRIPTAEQSAAFLDSKDPQKRRKLIDELLANPPYGEHFGIIWSDLIVKRDTNRGLNTDAFKKWLASSFNENRGWDKIVRDLLTSDGTAEKNPAATFFVAHRDQNTLQPSKVVDTAANLFMGVQLQCAQCHNHPFIREYKQNDFWGVAAFFSQTRASGGRVGAQNTPVSITESESAGGGGRRPGFGFARPSLSGGKIEIPDATDPRRRTGKIVKAKFFQDEEPALGEKGPYRPVFADWLVSTKNKFFAPASVNRLWAHFFARGFVMPLDDMNEDNPPSHPELLQLLAEEFRASGHDQKHLIRAICNSKTYQRTSKPLKENEHNAKLFSHQALKIMSPEVLYDSLCLALGTTELRTNNGGGRPGFGGGFRGFNVSSRAGFVNFFNTKDDSSDVTEMTFGIPQYLRLMNSQPFNQGGAVIDKLVKDGASTDKVVESLFLGTLSRRPTEAEAKKLAAYVARKSEAKEGYLGVLWILINSAEFVCVR